MKEVRYFYVPEAATQVELPAEEATHALRVLRLKGGDEIFLMDGEGSFYRAEVTAASSKRCLYEIKETMPQLSTSSTWSKVFSMPALSSSLLSAVICFMSTEISAVLFLGMALR
jgi:RsmE family RNA methyltransferase